VFKNNEDLQIFFLSMCLNEHLYRKVQQRDIRQHDEYLQNISIYYLKF